MPDAAAKTELSAKDGTILDKTDQFNFAHKTKIYYPVFALSLLSCIMYVLFLHSYGYDLKTA